VGSGTERVSKLLISEGEKARHKSCLEWVLCVAFFSKYFFQEATFLVIIFVGEGMRRQREV
jgi:energy-converting hydrogenase Eha subunit G